MNRKNKILSIIIVIIAIVITSCNSKYPGFKKTDNGLYYKFYTQNKDAQKVQIGDILKAELTVRTADSTVFSNAGNPQRIFRVDSSVYKGDLNEALLLMATGDSATFILSADSIRKYMQLPPYIKEGSALYYDIKIHEIITKEAFEKEAMKFAEEGKAAEADSLKSYIEKNKITVNPTESGLYFIETKKGNGAKAENGKKVKVNYTGKLIDGTVFDTSIEKEAKEANIYNDKRPYEPISFVLGRGEVIPGWEEGISMMKVGGKARLIIPSSIGYGQRGAGGGAIKPFSTLVFDVELIGVE